ncbi:MAG TPA: L-threonylcarbamoyladenylate synthase [Kofleriaceae bacterium]|jgi:L-threonylcarbamoyladenylate synthase|nr:L-threonylcarbamoyladenylate synthase [Kofleriaceae bacterium]
MERGRDLARAVAVLRGGGLVAFPTETVYGLGADAASDAAVARIFQAKGRPRAHPLIVHLADDARLDDWAIDVPEVARRLARAAWPGPLTIILRRGPRVAAAVTGGAETVGLRVPAHPVAQALLRGFGGGIAAPSANRFGAVSPTTAGHVAGDLGDAVDYLLDGGACEIGVESTIVDLSRGRAVLLRPGGLARAQIEPITGPLGVPDNTSPAAPGTLPSHYAPRAEVVAALPDEVPAAVAGAGALGAKVAVLAPAAAFAMWAGPPGGPPPAYREYRLPDDIAGMARGLYGALRDLDAAGVDVVIAALPPAVGLGEAVGDRLRRAAGPRRNPS